MRTETPKTIYLKDYQPFPFEIEKIDLNFDLQSDYTIVTAMAKYKRTASGDLYLYGEALELLSLKIDGSDYADYVSDDKSLTVKNLADQFTLEIETKIYPEKNTRLEGLYMSGGNYCTQCEAEGFSPHYLFP